MQRIVIVITALQMIAVPLFAFLLRMAMGDTKSSDEVIISTAIRNGLSKLGIPMENYGTH